MTIYTDGLYILMAGFTYCCPACGCTNGVHEVDCKHEFVPLSRFEKCYIDILSSLMHHTAAMKTYDAPVTISESMLKRRVEDVQGEDTKNPWLSEHQECLEQLITARHITRTGDGLRLTRPEERAAEVIPTFEPVQTIYECGPVDGAKDYSVYTMVSWCSLKELTWEQTQNFCTEWLRETGAWDRCSWGEGSIAELLDDKRHVWQNDMGWGDYADIAAREIQSHDIEPQIDVRAKTGVDPSVYEDE